MLQRVIVKTKNAETLRPLLRSALQRELKYLEQGIRRTQARLTSFEQKYGMSTAEFLSRFNQEYFRGLHAILVSSPIVREHTIHWKPWMRLAGRSKNRASAWRRS